MTASSFYRSIYPTDFGVRVLAVLDKGAPPRHYFFETDEDLIAAAAAHDRPGRDVYHACAVYSESTNRKGENAKAAKSLWVDLDVGPNKPYGTAKEAAEHLEAFRVEAGLQPPHLVKSGSGIHAYFPFDKAINPDQWRRLASAMAACMDHYGVGYDPSRATDIASILRIPDTHNYKTDPPKPVKLLRLGESEPAGTIWKRLKDYAELNDLLLDAAPAKTIVRQPVERNELMGNVAHAPSFGERIAQHCAVIGEVAETGGDVGYEIWWRALGIAKHTVEPEETAAHWTRNRDSTGHDQSDWQTVMATWAVGPTTCAEFSKHSDKCRECPHFEKANGTSFSPIILGADEMPVIQPLSLGPAQTTQVVKSAPAPWEFAADWIVDAVAKKFRVGISNEAMTMSVRQDDGSFKHEVFCARYWQVMQRIKAPDGTWQLEIGFKDHNQVRFFNINSADVCRPEPLKTAFGAKECHITPNQRAMSKTQEILMWEQARLHEYRMETVTYPVMGWSTLDHVKTAELTGEFVIGDTLFAPKQPPKKVLLGESVDGKLVSGLATKGTTEEWIALVDHIYNRPGAEAYQFCIAASLAAPLVKLVPGAGDWHGIPIVLTGSSGAAKTSTALAALSVWGAAQSLRFNAGTKESQGDTVTALAIKIGALNNIPFLMDEMSGLEPAALGGISYMLSNGRSRDRSDSSGQKLVENNQSWNTISFATANDDFHEKLALLPDSQTQDATKLRCFQIPFFEADIYTVFDGVHKTTIEVDLLAQQYGCVGRDWVQYLVNNRAAVETVLGKHRATFKIENDDRSAIRFYKDLLMTIEVSSRIAKRKGLIDWDVDAMMAWARGHLIRLRDGIFDKDWDSTISDFIASLHGRTIVTKYMKLGRGRRTTTETPLENLSSAYPPVARRAIEDRLLFVTSNALHDWCKEKRLSTSVVIDEMHKRGFFTNRKAAPPEVKPRPALINLGSGTSVTRAQAQCYELDFDVVVNRCGSDKAQAADNEWAEGKLTDLQEVA